MPKDPPHSPSGFYHITFSLDLFDDPLRTDAMVARPISDSEAAELKQWFAEIGRNQLCSCGSGLKFKKCCLRTGH